MKELITVHLWNPSTNEEIQVNVSLDDMIRNPSGYKMADLGLALLNKERRSRNLTEYQYNFQTGTFDEVSK